jgi:subfamily B ATP-binding cassette protein MsbA
MTCGFGSITTCRSCHWPITTPIASNILTDVLSLVGMIVVMFWLRWDFALIAIAVIPLLAVVALRVNKAVRAAVSEVRNRQSDLLTTLQEGLQSIEVIQAFSREDRQEQQLQKVSTESVTAWLQARRVSALLSPVVTLAVAVSTGLVLWRGSLLVLSGAMTVGSLSVFLAYLARFFQPVRDLTQMTNTIATVSVGFQRVTAVCDADTVIAERPAPRDPHHFAVRSPSRTCRSPTTPTFRCCATSPSTSDPARWWASSGPPVAANQPQ